MKSNNIRNTIFLVILFSVFSYVFGKSEPVTKTEKNTTDTVGNLYKQAVKLHQSGDLKSAVELYNQVIEFKIDYAEVYYNRANIFYQQKRYEHAIADYQKLITLRPLLATAYGNLSWLLIEQGKFAEAQPYCKKAYELDKSYYSWAVNLGHSYLLQGDSETARRYYQETLSLIPDHASFEQGPLVDIDLFIKNGWQVAAAKAEKKWMQDTFVKKQSERSEWNKLYKQAFSAYEKGNYKNGTVLAKQALKIAQTQYGEKHLYTLITINNLADLYRVQGQNALAELLYKQSLVLNSQVLGEHHPITSFARTGLAWLYTNQGRYQLAEPLYKRSLALNIQVQGEQHPDTLINMHSLAVVYKLLGQHALAESLFKQVLVFRTRVLGEQHPSTLTVMNNLANLYLAQGQYTLAESLFKKTLLLMKQVSGEQHIDTLAAMNNLANLYRDQGQYTLAEPLFKQTLALSKQVLGEQHPTTLTGMNNLAHLYYVQGQYTLAEPIYKQALLLRKLVSGEQHPETLMIMQNLAELYRVQGQYILAESLFKQTLVLNKQVLGEQHPNTLHSLSKLAELYRVQGQYVLAEPLFKQTLALRKKVLGEQHPDTLVSMNNMAILYYNQGQYVLAEQLYKKTLAFGNHVLGEDHPTTLTSMKNLATFYQNIESWTKAEDLWKLCFRLSNQVLQQLLWGSSEKTRQSYIQQQEMYLNNYLSFYSFRNTPEEILYFSLSRKGLLLRISSEISALAKKSDDPTIQKQVTEFNALRTQLSSLIFSGKAVKEQLQVLEEKINDTEMLLSQKVSSLKRSKTEVTPEDVLNKLEPEQTLIDFLIYKELNLKTQKYKTDQVIALIADQQGVKLIKLGEFAPIATTIKNYRLAIEPTYKNSDNQYFSNSRQQTLAQAAQILYQKLWQPLEGHLENKKTLYVIPDGLLHLLPFKALQNNEGKYLAEQYQLVLLASARDIVLPPLQGGSTQATIFAAPDYGDGRSILSSGNTPGASELKNIHFKPLANALQEGQQIDKLFRKKQPKSPAKLYLKNQATEHAILTTNNPKILHLATHGFFLEDQQTDEKNLKKEFRLMRSINQPAPQLKIDNPLTRSGLAFANANLGVKGIKQADDTDGILTALEVLNLDLIGTDLVTLSACDTGKGDIKNGEGVYSLNRAFQEAGAKAVLSTLWQVNDEATAKFMQNFYNRFLDGIPAQQAIQETQLEFIHDEKYHDTFYWAGFVMTGKE